MLTTQTCNVKEEDEDNLISVNFPLNFIFSHFVGPHIAFVVKSFADDSVILLLKHHLRAHECRWIWEL